MSSRPRVLAIVVGVAVVAAAAVSGITLATRQSPRQLQPLEGKPGIPAVLPTKAASQIRAAYRDWPKGSLNAMENLGREFPRDPVVQLYRGIALIWAGYDTDALVPLRAAKRLGRDTPLELQADNLLHSEYFPNYPVFVPSGTNPLLRRGATLQAKGHQHSAEKLYLLAAKRAPGDAEAQVAAAVGRFDKDNLSASFSRLGPLTRKFPRSQSVRYHLGLLLAWTGQRNESITQFEKVVALGKDTSLGKSAALFLKKIGTVTAQPPGK